MRASTANLNDNHIEPPPHPGPSGIHASTDIWKAKPSDPSAQAGPSGVRASTPIWKDKSIAPPAQAGTSGIRASTAASKYCCSCKRDVPARNFSAHLRSLSHKAHEWETLDESVKICRTAFGGKIDQQIHSPGVIKISHFTKLL
ncbi:unnamed protein product, partial [Callosobruchus maculatus]